MCSSVDKLFQINSLYNKYRRLKKVFKKYIEHKNYIPPYKINFAQEIMYNSFEISCVISNITRHSLYLPNKLFYLALAINNKQLCIGSKKLYYAYLGT